MSDRKVSRLGEDVLRVLHATYGYETPGVGHGTGYEMLMATTAANYQALRKTCQMLLREGLVTRSMTGYLYHPHDVTSATTPTKGNWSVFRLTPAGAAYVDQMWARMRLATTAAAAATEVYPDSGYDDGLAQYEVR